MAKLFCLVPHSLHLAPDTRLIKAADWARYCEAGELLKEARLEAGRIREEAGQAYEEEKRRGFEAGVQEGRMEQAGQMLDTAMKAIDYIENLEAGVVTLVSNALRKILGELPPEERIVSVVRHALSLVQGQKKVLLRVSQEDEAAVQAELSALLRRYSAISFLEVTADPRLAQGDCLLESEMGVIDAGLETQLQAIVNTLEKRHKG
ncbi:HrpE/YscL family type III secretion apparatus protein [Desulfovibrio sp. OttesenSCG-928-G11]|nr:HrpE/YscL family type III secretion apparatus protein [Desulfovibrio sp. OttesenSCG-928-G11]